MGSSTACLRRLEKEEDEVTPPEYQKIPGPFLRDTRGPWDWFAQHVADFIGWFTAEMAAFGKNIEDATNWEKNDDTNESNNQS